jgi:hypothetical protein
MKPIVATLLLGCLLPSGCATRAASVSVHHTDNVEVTVEKLFTHDGCTVYRFRDVGYHYYVRCDAAGSAMTHSLEPCGRGCVRDATVPTVERRGPTTPAVGRNTD